MKHLTHKEADDIYIKNKRRVTIKNVFLPAIQKVEYEERAKSFFIQLDGGKDILARIVDNRMKWRKKTKDYNTLIDCEIIRK